MQQLLRCKIFNVFHHFADTRSFWVSCKHFAYPYQFSWTSESTFNPQKFSWSQRHYPAGIYLVKVNNREFRTRCEICWKFTIKTPKWRHWCRSGVFINNFEHISHLALVFLLLTLTCNCRRGSIIESWLYGCFLCINCIKC